MRPKITLWIARRILDYAKKSNINQAKAMFLETYGGRERATKSAIDILIKNELTKRPTISRQLQKDADKALRNIVSDTDQLSLF